MRKLTIDAESEKAAIPTPVWVLGIVFRTLFILVLVLMTARVASPQIEKIWSAYETPSEVVRLALGFAVCVWLVYHIFILPKDAGGYRIWAYLGLAVVPLSVLCAVVIW